MAKVLMLSFLNFGVFMLNFITENLALRGGDDRKA
jgi:hypothetical protein